MQIGDEVFIPLDNRAGRIFNIISFAEYNTRLLWENPSLHKRVIDAWFGTDGASLEEQVAEIRLFNPRKWDGVITVSCPLSLLTPISSKCACGRYKVALGAWICPDCNRSFNGVAASGEPRKWSDAISCWLETRPSWQELA